ITSHEPADVLPWADKIIVLKNGKIIQEGTATAVYKKPLNEYVAGLLGSYNLLDQKTFGEKKILRPEEILITDDLSEEYTGIVTSIRFMGSYYEIEVEIKSQILKIKTGDDKISVGDKVGIYF
ncbi:MAG: TOBE domain-containing protein, partial [Ferruginibacter sp.]|nr:TOBE domain-containing protein [Ferruginibacter sp.]